MIIKLKKQTTITLPNPGGGLSLKGEISCDISHDVMRPRIRISGTDAKQSDVSIESELVFDNDLPHYTIHKLKGEVLKNPVSRRGTLEVLHEDDDEFLQGINDEVVEGCEEEELFINGSSSSSAAKKAKIV